LIPALTKAILTLSLIINVLDIDTNKEMQFCLHPTREEKKSELIFEMVRTYETIAYQIKQYALLECIIQSICLIIIRHPNLMKDCDAIIERATNLENKANYNLKLQVCTSIRD